MSDVSTPKEVGIFLGKVRNEVKRARDRFPTNTHQLAALTEEVGELNQAMIECGGLSEAEDVYQEAVQVAAMALRVAVEGDRSFSYEPPTQADER